MWSAAIVIPLAAMAIPIVLILLAVLVDVLFLAGPCSECGMMNGPSGRGVHHRSPVPADSWPDTGT
jgi:hypothetical protein